MVRLECATCGWVGLVGKDRARECPVCVAALRGELAIFDPDDTELEHEGPYFWNR